MNPYTAEAAPARSRNSDIAPIDAFAAVKPTPRKNKHDSSAMTGSLINARVVVRYGLYNTLRAGLLISLTSALAIALLSSNAAHFMPVMALLSCLFFLGVGLTAANASMGAISLFRERAGAASAVYGFTHALLASAIGALAGELYRGRLIEPALIILACAVLAISGLALTRSSQTAKET